MLVCLPNTTRFTVHSIPSFHTKLLCIHVLFLDSVSHSHHTRCLAASPIHCAAVSVVHSLSHHRLIDIVLFLPFFLSCFLTSHSTKVSLRLSATPCSSTSPHHTLSSFLCLLFFFLIYSSVTVLLPHKLL